MAVVEPQPVQDPFSAAPIEVVGGRRGGASLVSDTGSQGSGPRPVHVACSFAAPEGLGPYAM